MIRRQQTESAREQLLDAAADEFRQHGLGGTRIQDVLERANVTKGGLYHHFTNKQEIAEALATSEAAHWLALIAEVREANSRGLASIEMLCVAVVTRLEGDVRARAVLRIADELDLPEATAPFARWHDFVILSLQQAIADGEVPDAIAIREIATVIVECLYGVCASPAPMSVQEPAQARFRRLWSVLGPGLRAASV